VGRTTDPTDRPEIPKSTNGADANSHLASAGQLSLRCRLLPLSLRVAARDGGGVSIRYFADLILIGMPMPVKPQSIPYPTARLARGGGCAGRPITVASSFPAPAWHALPLPRAARSIPLRVARAPAADRHSLVTPATS